MIKRLVITTLAAMLSAAPALTVQASSHREAPFITEQPKVDGTDFYMFRSYEPGREDFVTVVANYLPLQDPYGGPNYFSLDPEALYEIHFDNNGDAKEDITFQFRFKQMLQDIKLDINGKQVSIPLRNSGPIGISTGTPGTLNDPESYTVDIVRGDRRTGKRDAITNSFTGATVFDKPVDNIGTKSVPNYAVYASTFVHDIQIPGCADGRMFVGQRKDPFVIALGKVFDLINTNPLGPVDGNADILADKNVTSLILELPISCLTQGDPVIGGWTSASLRQGRLLKKDPSYDNPTKEGGPWAQVSRLGMPLVNEVVIGLKDKNRFNAGEPKDDAQFADYVTNPTLPALIEILFPSAPAPILFPRDDLVAAFLTGINTTTTGNLNQPANVVPSEMLRLNTSIPAAPKGSQNALGVIGGDLAGYPNGRRPGDDIVDISLRVVMGKLIADGLYGNPSQAPAGNAPLTDGAAIDDSMFDNVFPYLGNPLPGAQ